MAEESRQPQNSPSESEPKAEPATSAARLNLLSLRDVSSPRLVMALGPTLGRRFRQTLSILS